MRGKRLRSIANRAQAQTLGGHHHNKHSSDDRGKEREARKQPNLALCLRCRSDCVFNGPDLADTPRTPLEGEGSFTRRSHAGGPSVSRP